MTAFTYERDLEHPVTPKVEATILDALQEHLNSQELESVLVNPGLDPRRRPSAFRSSQVPACGTWYRSTAAQR